MVLNLESVYLIPIPRLGAMKVCPTSNRPILTFMALIGGSKRLHKAVVLINFIFPF